MSVALSPFQLRSPDEFAATLERLGPVTTKVGQYLSLRRDLLPPEYCAELLRLTDTAPPFPWHEARDVLVRELGGEPERLFDYFDRTPYASGSLAQVHRARLQDGTEAAVKILRPNIDRAVKRDLTRLRRLARMIDRVGWTLPLSATDLIEEISVWLRRELDLAREFANARRLWDLTASDPAQRVPEVFSRLSSARVITYEFLRGVRVSSVLAGFANLAAEDRNEFARNLVEACLTQLFRYQFFHADLHPGNLMVLPGNAVGFVDFGFCDQLDDSVRNNQLRYLTAVYNDDVQRMFRSLVDILIATPDANEPGFRRDFVNDRRLLEGRIEESRDGDREELTRPAGDYLSSVLNAARRNGYRVPTPILSIYRALLTAEMVAARMGLRDGLRQVGSNFFRRLQRRELVSSLTDQDRKQQIFLSLLNLTRDSPRQINQILTDIAEGTLTLKVEVTEDSRTAKSRKHRARLNALSILSVGIAVLLVRPGLPVVLGVPLEWVLVTAFAALFVGAFLYWRRL